MVKIIIIRYRIIKIGDIIIQFIIQHFGNMFFRNRKRILDQLHFIVCFCRKPFFLQILYLKLSFLRLGFRRGFFDCSPDLLQCILLCKLIRQDCLYSCTGHHSYDQIQQSKSLHFRTRHSITDHPTQGKGNYQPHGLSFQALPAPKI